MTGRNDPRAIHGRPRRVLFAIFILSVLTVIVLSIAINGNGAQT